LFPEFSLQIFVSPTPFAIIAIVILLLARFFELEKLREDDMGRDVMIVRFRPIES